MSLKSTTNTAANTYELIMEIDAAAFEAAVEKAYQKQKKNIAVPGFRKGKVTRKMAEKMFGEGCFYEDAVQALAPAETMAAVDEANLDIVDQPQLEVVSVDKENGLVLKAVCTVKPDITIENYKGIKAPKVVEEVTDEKVDEQLKLMAQRNARIVAVEDRAAAMGDEVTIDFEGFTDGVAFDGGKAEDFALTLGSGQFIPGFEEAIVGHNAGEQFDIDVTFPAEYQAENLAGKPAVFKINLKEIKVQQLPEIDDEFAKDTSEFDTIDELKADLKSKLTENAENKANLEFESKVFQTVIDSVQGEIPQCMFDQRVDRLISEFDQRLRSQGMSLELYLRYTGMDMDALRESHAQRANDEVKLRLALEKIAKLEGFTVEDEDVQKGIADIAEQNNVDVETVKRIISEDDYRMDLLVEKASEFVKENAVVDNSLAEETKSEETAE